MAGRHGEYETQEFIAELYDVTYENRSLKDVDFFVEYSRKTKGRILELGCGTGRVLIPIAISGCEVTGLDISPYMLRKCREKLSELPKEVQKRVRLDPGKHGQLSAQVNLIHW